MALYGGFIHKNNSGKFMGRRVGHRRCRIVSGIKNKNMKNSLMIKWFTGRRLCQISQTILHGRDAILRVRDKLLISNIILQLWTDVKYHVPTGFFVVKRRVVFILLARQKAVFYVFCFGAPSIYPLNRFFYVLINWNDIFFDYICTLRWIKSQNYKFKHQQLWKRHLRVSFLH